MSGKKIAIVGTSPHFDKAPFGNPDWEIWGVPGTYRLGDKIHRIIEVHNFDISAYNLPDLIDFYAKLGPNLMIGFPHPSLPQATRFDFQKHLAIHGRVFSSSVAWMLSEAIEQNPDEIGIFGVDMAHDSEYGYQRPSCMYLIGYAKGRGIKVTMPEDCSLMQIQWLYGMENPPVFPQVLQGMVDRAEAALDSMERTKRETELQIEYQKGLRDAANQIPLLLRQPRMHDKRL